jgi:very-short-patch-repair endonuclease
VSTQPEQPEQPEPSWDDVVEDPVGHGYSEEYGERLRGERTVARVGNLLHARGKVSAAALMLDVQAFALSHQWTDGAGGFLDGSGFYEAILDVESYLVPRFTPERLDEILDALAVVLDHEGHQGVSKLRIREVLPVVGDGWREQLMRDLAAERPNNQARKVRLEPHRRTADGMFLTNLEEEKVYAVLRDFQQKQPDVDTVLIAPLPGVRVKQTTLTPDFLVAYRGRVGVIEVDGPHHHGRFGADASRDRLLRAAGVRLVDRILVEDLRSRASVDAFVENFFRQLVAA